MWASDGLNALRRSGEDELLMSVLLGLSVRSQKAGEYHGLMIQPNVRCAERTFGTVQSALYLIVKLPCGCPKRRRRATSQSLSLLI